MLAAMDNPWLRRRVLAYAHQGGALEAPSSTLYALRRAVALGATALELDVHLTRDGQVVVAHDPTVERLTDGTGAIAALTLAELRALDAAYRFELPERPGEYPFRGRAPDDPALRMATLDEVLDAFPTTFLNFDIKAGSDGSFDCAEATARTLRARHRPGDFIVASFDDALSAAFAELAPEIGTSAGTGAAMAVWQAVQEGAPLPAMRHVALQLPAHFQGQPVVTEELVARAHDAHLAVHVWTIDDRFEMAALLTLGVDGIITDRPSVLVPVLAARGLTYRG